MIIKAHIKTDSLKVEQISVQWSLNLSVREENDEILEGFSGGHGWGELEYSSLAEMKKGRYNSNGTYRHTELVTGSTRTRHV